LQSVTPKAQDQILLVIAIASASCVHISIAISQILLGVGIALLLVFRHRLQFPRIWIPLVCCLSWTIAADLLCPDPWKGRAQIRKFFVFLFIPLIYGVFSTQLSKVRYLLIGWMSAATASGAWGLVQYVQKYEAAKHSGKDFYVAYLERRITGFESHWMTFGALQLSVLSLLLAHRFFASRRFSGWIYLVTGSILSAAIVLGWTRSIWLATIPSVLYLLWFWRPKMVLLAPVVAVVAFAVAPHTTRERLMSLVQPHGDTDSNRHRIVTARTGVQMIKAHPWFGIGPEEIGRQFDSYVPADVKRPLPTGYYGHLHNIYLQYAAERGIPGMLFMMWFIGLTLWDCFRSIRVAPRPSTELFLLHGTVAVTLGILVGGLFEYNLGDSEVLMMFVCVVSLGYAAVENTLPRRTTLVPPRRSADTVSPMAP
jgi:O-antigen ligase